MTEKQKAIFRKTCETLADNDGICIDIDCSHCPFSWQHNNKGLDCMSAKYSAYGSKHYMDPLVVKSAEQWLKDNPVMKRVGENWKAKARRLNRRAKYGC